MKMAKYCLVYVLEGKAKKYHLELSKRISKTFKVSNPSKRVAPHITLKYLGEIKKENISNLKNKIEEISKQIEKFNIQLEGINNFEKEVIFIDVKKTKKLMNNYLKIYSEITKLNFIQKIPQFEGRNVHFHATLCAHDIKNKFDEIMKYLSEEKPKYKASFNNLVLKKKIKNIWKPIKMWKLT